MYLKSKWDMTLGFIDQTIYNTFFHGPIHLKDMLYFGAYCCSRFCIKRKVFSSKSGMFTPNFTLFKEIKSCPLYRGCPQDSLTIGHCPLKTTLFQCQYVWVVYIHRYLNIVSGSFNSTIQLVCKVQPSIIIISLNKRVCSAMYNYV